MASREPARDVFVMYWRVQARRGVPGQAVSMRIKFGSRGAARGVRRRDSREAGYSLVETTVIGVVVTMLASSIMSALPGMMRATDEATRITAATSLAEHVGAEVRQVPYGNLGALHGRIIDEAALTGTALEDLEGFSAVLRVVEVLPVLQKIEIAIHHESPGTRNATSVVVLRSAVYRAAR